jgi:hypothetical protein
MQVSRQNLHFGVCTVGEYVEKHLKCFVRVNELQTTLPSDIFPANGQCISAHCQQPLPIYLGMLYETKGSIQTAVCCKTRILHSQLVPTIQNNQREHCEGFK